jgi:hypothetical protein
MSLLFVSFFILSPGREPGGNMKAAVSNSIQEALHAYDAEYIFARRVLPPEEDRAKLTAARWEGGYRWFRAQNVICLEKARKLRAEGRI